MILISRLFLIDKKLKIVILVELQELQRRSLYLSNKSPLRIPLDCTLLQ